MPLGSEVLIAAAGSGKTRRLIEEALADQNSRVLITTYTRENLSEIEARLWEATGGRSHNVSVVSWYEFLLREGVKPYQSYKTDILRVRSLNFVTDPSVTKYFKKSNFLQYYLDKGSNVYSDVVSDLVCVLDAASGGRVVNRIESLYDVILIDEMQDLAGWDLELVELLMKSRSRVLMVGDPRQAVYSTNRSNKNSQFRGAKITDWIGGRVAAKDCTTTTLSVSYRCNQLICDFADDLYPNLPKTTSSNSTSVEAMGVHLVHVDDLDVYRARYRPQALRWNKTNKQAGPHALNFGEVKGREFDRVLIFPTPKMTEYVENAVALSDGIVSRFYVGVTRAKHSVGIVTSTKATKSGLKLWEPPVD